MSDSEREAALEYAIEQLSGGKKGEEEADLYGYLCDMLTELRAPVPNAASAGVWMPVNVGTFSTDRATLAIDENTLVIITDAEKPYEHYTVDWVLPNDYRICRLVADAPQVPQPDWSQAPEWAMWWTVDPDGDAFWWSLEPSYPDGYTWDRIEGGQCTRADYGLIIPLGIDWRTLKAQRPQEGVGG